MSEAWLVACLCAEWCGSCREYHEVFERIHGEFGEAARFAWVDIEDHPEVLGSVEVEDFPALLIARGDEVAFFGPVTPHAATLSRLVQTALAGGLRSVTDSKLDGVPARVRALSG